MQVEKVTLTWIWQKTLNLVQAADDVVIGIPIFLQASDWPHFEGTLFLGKVADRMERSDIIPQSISKHN